jgi:2-(1,2-epoxy-1,2-dihydrophenyl)acetyl-CoA isomerase
MKYQTLELTIEKNLAIVKFTKPDVLNSLNSLMRAELKDVIKYAETRSRCIVLTGAGTVFCSGQDLGYGANISKVDLERTLREEYIPLLRAIHDCKVPTISAVNGIAAGAGANLAFCTDIVIATESAFFVQPFSKIGLIPDGGSSYFVPKNIGLARAIGIAFFAEKISAMKAQEIGMIWECVSDKNFENHWKNRAKSLTKGPTQSFIRARKAFRDSFNNHFEEQMKLEAKFQGELGETHDFKEGVLAFLHKRDPDFEGR